MKSSRVRQYTVRNLPPELDRRLRQTTRETGKSLNEVVIDTLRKGSGLSDGPHLHHDLDFLIGTWTEDPEFDKAIEEQDQVDPDLWK